MQNVIKQEIQRTLALLKLVENDEKLLQAAENIARQCVHSIRHGGKILFCGNGGSAADSQHLAAELVSRLSYNRPAMAGIALTTDTSALTAIGNDYSFDFLFSRQVEAIGRNGDVLIGISTSGKSPNVLRAFEAARALGIFCVGFTRDSASMMEERCDLVLNIPSKETPKIQECHMLFGHTICGLIEEEIYGAEYNPMRQTQAVGA
jgi:D-sedoheptulose 7-phosphate isomerase